MRELKFITVFPIDNYFSWQCHLWLESLREIEQSQNAIVLMFIPLGRELDPKWNNITSLYPEAEFHYIKDDGSVDPLLKFYIPILRPYCMKQYCKAHPEIKEKAVLYCDSDILFMKGFNVSHLLEDDVVYGSDTNSYINASYFDSKIKDVLPHKLEEYKTIDVLDDCAKIVGIDRKTCEANNLHSIGTQYLLKNTDEQFWQRVFNNCLPIMFHLKGVNRQYFLNENKGFQSWVNDMFAVLWNTWKRGQETRIAKEMDFAWATDHIDKLKTTYIFHNAGVTGDYTNGKPYFFKGKYIQGNDPTTDPHIKIVLQQSENLCTWWYAHKLMELKDKYHLNY